MKLLIAHNRYRSPGGEDVVFSREGALLRSAGHEVVEYVRQNMEMPNDGILKNMKTGIRTLWAWDTARELRSILRKERPQLVHFHNTFPLISPAAYYTCKEEGAAVVQSLHNHRLVCPARTRRLCALSGPAGSREGHKDSTEGLAKAKTHSFDDSRGRPTPKRGPRVSERESLGDSVFAFASTKMSRVDERRALFDLAIGRISGDLRTCCHRGLCLRIARDCLLFRCDAGIGGRSKDRAALRNRQP